MWLFKHSGNVKCRLSTRTPHHSLCYGFFGWLFQAYDEAARLGLKSWVDANPGEATPLQRFDPQEEPQDEENAEGKTKPFFPYFAVILAVSCGP